MSSSEEDVDKQKRLEKAKTARSQAHERYQEVLIKLEQLSQQLDAKKSATINEFEVKETEELVSRVKEQKKVLSHHASLLLNAITELHFAEFSFPTQHVHDLAKARRSDSPDLKIISDIIDSLQFQLNVINNLDGEEEKIKAFRKLRSNLYSNPRFVTLAMPIIEKFLKMTEKAPVKPSFDEAVLRLRSLIIYQFITFASPMAKDRDIIDCWIEGFRVLEIITAISLLKNLETNTVVISIGSAGSYVQQKCPNLCKELAKTEKVAVINLDPWLNNSGLNVVLSDKNLEVYELRGNYPCFQAGVYPKNLAEQLLVVHRHANEQFLTSLQDFLKNPNKRLIIIDNTSPYLKPWMHDFAKKHHELLGKNLELIGGYFADTPIFKYSPKALAEMTIDEINKIKIAAQKEFEACFSKDTSKYLVTPLQLINWNKQYGMLGTIYQNLGDIHLTNLFASQELRRSRDTP